MICRKNVAELSPDDMRDFVDAVLALKDGGRSPSRVPAAASAVTNGGGVPNRYDDYVWIHSVVGTGAHRGPAFGPWHREFLRQFEYDLQRAINKPTLTIPYWDWINARAPGSEGWPFINELLGGFGSNGGAVPTGSVTSGPFADSTTFRMNTRLPGDNDLILKRSVGIPDPAFLPTYPAALQGLGIRVPLGAAWPSVYDANPLHSEPSTLSPTQRATQVNAAFRKYLEWLLHDGVHGWIGSRWVEGTRIDGGHMSFPSVAVNDPAFWLHHANVDRLWAIWQRKTTTPTYVPLTAGTANTGHNGSDTMATFSNPAHFNTAVLQKPIDVQDHHAIGYWYTSDPPIITLITPSVNFGNVPERLITYQPVQFSVHTCREVEFEVTAISAGNFSNPPLQGIVRVTHSNTSDTSIANIYVQFEALGSLGTAQPGTVTVVARTTDRDGFDAASPGASFDLGSWTINLTATPIERPHAAISLVLDRSGSMSESAGVAGTKYDLLKSSLQVVADIMRQDDGVGIIAFDDATSVLNGITAMGSTPAPGSGRAAIAQAIASPDLTPRGLTGIGQAMIAGAMVLDAERGVVSTPYSQFAIIVMTDGNENVPPLISDPSVAAATAPYSNTIYAIGLGTPGNVSDITLGSIANYMLITGDITTAERRFRLTKYFMQILAGVTRLAVVVDPQGDLHLGTEHAIPFFITESDVEIDVIVLCPIAPLLEFELETPDGTRINPTVTAPTILFQQNLEDTFYRLTLPLGPATRQSGQWTAILRLPKDALQRQWRDLERWWPRFEGLRQTGTLPYSLVVQSYSDLQLQVFVKPVIGLAGETITLYVALTEYGQPFDSATHVTVLVTDPQGQSHQVELQSLGNGYFEGVFSTIFPGLYQIRFLTQGFTRFGTVFQREETRTVSIFKDRVPEGVGFNEDDQRDLRQRNPGTDTRRGSPR